MGRDGDSIGSPFSRYRGDTTNGNHSTSDVRPAIGWRRYIEDLELVDFKSELALATYCGQVGVTFKYRNR